MLESPGLVVMAQGCRGLFHLGTGVIELVGALCGLVRSRGTDMLLYGITNDTKLLRFR